MKNLETLRIKEVKKMLKEANSAYIQAKRENKRTELQRIAKKHNLAHSLISAANKLQVFTTNLQITDDLVVQVINQDRKSRAIRRKRNKAEKKRHLVELEHETARLVRKEQALLEEKKILMNINAKNAMVNKRLHEQIDALEESLSSVKEINKLNIQDARRYFDIPWILKLWAKKPELITTK